MRYLFAGSEHFLLYDFWNDSGSVDENVFAFSNRYGEERALILYNNSYQSIHGTVHFSVGFLDKATGLIQQKSLSDGLHLPNDDSVLVAYRDNVVGLEYIRYVRDFRKQGLSVFLRGYQHITFLNWRPRYSTVEQPWDQLCDALHGSGVYNLDEALSKLKVRPLVELLQQAISTETVETFELLSRQSTLALTELIEQPKDGVILSESSAEPRAHRAEGVARLTVFMNFATRFSSRSRELMDDQSEEESSAPRETAADERRSQMERFVNAALKLPTILSTLPEGLLKSAAVVLPSQKSKVPQAQTWGTVLAWLVFHNANSEAHGFEAFEKFNLRWALAETFSSIGLEGEAAWKAAAQVRTLMKFSGKAVQEILCLEDFWIDPDVRWLIGVNDAHGIAYVNQERLEETLLWMSLPGLLDQESLTMTKFSPAAIIKFVDRIRSEKFEYLSILRFVRTKGGEPAESKEKSTANGRQKV